MRKFVTKNEGFTSRGELAAGVLAVVGSAKGGTSWVNILRAFPVLSGSAEHGPSGHQGVLHERSGRNGVPVPPDGGFWTGGLFRGGDQ